MADTGNFREAKPTSDAPNHLERLRVSGSLGPSGLALVLLGFGGSACAAEKPVKAPASERQAQSQKAPSKGAPLHVAPPPEYGNKVVLAARIGPSDKVR